MLPEELDAKLCKTNLRSRISGAVINSTMIHGILMRLIKEDMLKYGQYLDVEVTESFVNLVYNILMRRRASTMSRPAIPRAAWEEIRFQFLHVKEHNIPEVQILNADQTPSKYTPTRYITMEVKGSNHVAIAGSNEKRPITLTLVESLSGEILPFQIIYQGKTHRCLSKDAKFPNGCNETHWSNEAETLDCLMMLLSLCRNYDI